MSKARRESEFLIDKALLRDPIYPSAYQSIGDFFRHLFEKDQAAQRAKGRLTGRIPTRAERARTRDDLSPDAWLAIRLLYREELLKRRGAAASRAEVAEIDARIDLFNDAIREFEAFAADWESRLSEEESLAELPRADDFRRAHWQALKRYIEEYEKQPKPRELWDWMVKNSGQLGYGVVWKEKLEVFVFRRDGRPYQVPFGRFPGRHRSLTKRIPADKPKK